MVKIRLWGTNQELESAIAKVKATFKVVKISTPCRDRGKRPLYRVYIEVES